MTTNQSRAPKARAPERKAKRALTALRTAVTDGV